MPVEKEFNKRIAQKWSALTIDAEKKTLKKIVKQRPEPQRTILVGSDDKSLISMLTRFFYDSGFRISAADSGLSAAEVMMNQSPELMILEKELAQIDGATLCRDYKANKLTEPVPVVLILPEDVKFDEKAAKACKADLVIHRPLQELAFLCQINEFINADINIESFPSEDLKSAILMVLTKLPKKTCRKRDLFFELAIFFNIRNSFSLSKRFEEKLHILVDELKCTEAIEEYVLNRKLYLRLLEEKPYKTL